MSEERHVLDPGFRLERDEPGHNEQRPGEPDKRPGLRFTDRVFVAGQNGSGKSELVNYLLTLYRCQRFLLDTKDEWSIPGVEPASKPKEIDWSLPVVHYVDDRGDLRDYDRLFKLLLARRRVGLVVAVHELADLCGDQPGATPQWVSAYIRKGRAHGLGLLGASQRPVNVPKSARTEAQHAFAFAQGFDPDDRPVVAKSLRLTEPELNRVLDQAAAYGEHAYVWYDQRARRLAIRPPLPAHLRARIFVHRSSFR